MRIGVFGGTFDPVHNAHCFVAESARLLERLDRVLFVPTGNNHYRRQAAGGCGASLRDDPRRDREQPRLSSGSTPICARTPAATPPISFRVCTRSIPARALRSSSAPTRWPAQTGYVSTKCSRRSSDSRSRRAPAFRPTHWHASSRRCRRRCESASRPSICPKSRRPRRLVRNLLAQGRSVRYLVPEPVWKYITAHELYGYRGDGAAA